MAPWASAVLALGRFLSLCGTPEWIRKCHQGIHRHGNEKQMGDILVFGELSLQSLATEVVEVVYVHVRVCVFSI